MKALDSEETRRRPLGLTKENLIKLRITFCTVLTTGIQGSQNVKDPRIASRDVVPDRALPMVDAALAALGIGYEARMGDHHVIPGHPTVARAGSARAA
jgi:hypothetical protein